MNSSVSFSFSDSNGVDLCSAAATGRPSPSPVEFTEQTSFASAKPLESVGCEPASFDNLLPAGVGCSARADSVVPTGPVLARPRPGRGPLESAGPEVVGICTGSSRSSRSELFGETLPDEKFGSERVGFCGCGFGKGTEP